MPIHVLSNYDHSPDGVIYATHGALTVSATDVRYIKALCTLLSNIFLLNSIISLHIHFACRTRQSLVPLCLLLTAKSASRFILSAFCAKENVRVSKQHNQSLFKGTPTSFPSTLWTTTASGDVMDALTQVMIAQIPKSCDIKQASRTNAQTQSFRVQWGGQWTVEQIWERDRLCWTWSGLNSLIHIVRSLGVITNNH